MENKEMKAKVFISCGQRKDTDEVEIAKKLHMNLIRWDLNLMWQHLNKRLEA